MMDEQGKAQHGKLLIVDVSRIAFPLALVVMSITACSTEPTELSESSARSIRPDSARNKITITGDDRVLWNGQVVTLEQLAALLDQTRKMPVAPELQFQPDADANYELSAKVLDVVKASTVTKFGFVGNELYSESEAPAD